MGTAFEPLCFSSPLIQLSSFLTDSDAEASVRPFSNTECCLEALYLEKRSSGIFSSWYLIAVHLLFLTCAKHFPAWLKLCTPLLHLCLHFTKIHRKVPKQPSESALLCFFASKEKKAEGQRRNNSREMAWALYKQYIHNYFAVCV